MGRAPGSGLLSSPEMPPAFVSVLGLVLSLVGKMNAAFSGLWASGWTLRLSFLSRGVGAGQRETVSAIRVLQSWLVSGLGIG